MKVTYNSYFIKIVLLSVLYFTLPMVFGFIGDLSTYGSYVRSIFYFFLLTIISVILFLGKTYVKFYSIVFVVQILIGLLHYIVFVDPNYFSGQGEPSPDFWHEHQAIFSSVEKVINNKHSVGLFYVENLDSWGVTHPEIWQLILWPFVFLQHKWLNYAPLNIFSSLLASMNLMLVFNNNYPGKEGDYKSARKLLLIVTAFFPMFLFNDTLWRDPFGEALISIGLVMMTLSRSLIKKVISFIVLAATSFIQRTAYLLIVGAVTAIPELRVKKKTTLIILIPFFALLMYGLLGYFNMNEEEGYVDAYVKYTSVLALPIKLVLGLIGPFPWIQFLLAFEGYPYFAFQLSDYILGIFQLAYFFAILLNLKRFSFKGLGYMELMGFGIALSGFATSMMHIGYIAEGIYFTLPWFFKRMGTDYIKYFVWSLFFLIFLNVFVMTFGISGISSLWR